MTFDQIVTRIAEVLDEERQAIRVLDGKAVERFALEKTELLAALVAVSSGDRAANAASLQALSVLLRRNAILLVHARDALRDVLRAARGDGSATFPAGHPLRQGVEPGAHLSRKF